MINQLQKIFPSLVRYNANLNQYSDEFKWYLTDQEEIVGIHKSEITTNEEQLLSTFLSEYHGSYTPVTDKEKFWDSILHTENPVNPIEYAHPFRFIHFSFEHSSIDPTLFREAVHSIFSTPLPILWTTNHQGILIEDVMNSHEEPINYREIIDILMSDLYVKIRIFVGPFLTDLHHAKAFYTNFINGSSIVFSYTDKQVVSFEEALPFLFVDQVNESFRENTKNFLLKEVLDDIDLIQTVEAYFTCNLNVTLTAKKLYMHRNSLQYRIDKFIEKTGIDIRQFHQAAAVYLALLSRS